MLDLLPGGMLRCQFVLHRLQGPLSRLPVSLCSLCRLSRFILAETLVSQFRLEITDYALRFGQQALRTLSGFRLLPKALSRSVQLIAAMPVMLVMISKKDGDWHLTIADKTAPVGVLPVGDRC
jgi:hypothetical protein